MPQDSSNTPDLPPLRPRFLLGPAGSGKTHRCLAEIRAELHAAADGPPLILLAPKQATYQLERLLLAGDAIPGYARLWILSFERLADFLLAHAPSHSPEYLNEEGRVMVLRALLTRRQNELRVFRATARLPGFAHQLSQFLREVRRRRIEHRQLARFSERADLPAPLRDKLHDLSLLSQAYHNWLDAHQLQDADARLDLAAAVLAESSSQGSVGSASWPVTLGGLWLDGFAEMTPQETHLLTCLLRRCRRATLAFCLNAEPREDASWLSVWSVVSRSFRAVHARVSELPGCRAEVEVLRHDRERNRFSRSPALARLERSWAEPLDHAGCAIENVAGAAPEPNTFNDDREPAVRLVRAANLTAEAALAAREIRRWVRERGGRFRDVAVLLRSFDGYHDAVRRAFQRYEIPFFLDRRESVAHHPLAELTRFALRTVVYHWPLEDWLGALKTGLMPATEDEIDELETAARAHGWTGETWHRPLRAPQAVPGHEGWERIRQRVVRPFLRLSQRLTEQTGSFDGPQVADAIRELWSELMVERTLANWSQPRLAAPAPLLLTSIHAAVWEQMRAWLENLERGFRDVPIPLREWLPVIEAGLCGLTVGAVPPALDQVLVGTIDRSRNPNPRLVFLLGLNQSVFPARPAPPVLLTESDRADLGRLNVDLGPDAHQQLSQEQYYGYIACTRASERLIATCAVHDDAGRALNPSLFFDRLLRLFPNPGAEPDFGGQPSAGRANRSDEPRAAASIASSPAPSADTGGRLTTQTGSGLASCSFVEHADELVRLLVQIQAQGPLPEAWAKLLRLPAVAPVLVQAAQLAGSRATMRLSAAHVARLYGAELRTSVTALEEFAACPFKFFVARGLRAAERETFRADPRERGSFQHEVLKAFHQSLQAEGRRWRDLSPPEAGERVAQIAAHRLPVFREGLLDRNPIDRLAARLMIEDLHEVVETLVGWMPQYGFDPSLVEVGFGLDETRWPGWSLHVDTNRHLVLRGRIDRVDLCPVPSTGETLVVIIDYKSRTRTLDVTRLHHGLDLQLLAYLNALIRTGPGQPDLGHALLRPAGAFYVGLRPETDTAASRSEAHAAAQEAQTTSHQHTGRFVADALTQFDNRQASVGDQFRYRRKKDGDFDRRGTEALPATEFSALLDRNEAFLRQHAAAIFSGDVGVKPFRIRKQTACEACDYRSICRFDPWLHPYRLLSPPPKPSSAATRARPSARRES